MWGRPGDGAEQGREVQQPGGGGGRGGRRGVRQAATGALWGGRRAKGMESSCHLSLSTCHLQYTSPHLSPVRSQGVGGPLPSPRTLAASLLSRPSKEGATITVHLMQV